MLNACHALKNVWNVAMDPVGRLNFRLACSVAEGLINSSPSNTLPKSPLDLKNGQEANVCNHEQPKRRKVATESDTHWSSPEAPISIENSFLPHQNDEVSDMETTVSVSEKQVEALRTWQWTTLGQRYNSCKKDSSAVEFTLMSYNILSQDLLECNRYLYKHCQSPILEWEYRKDNLMAEIKKINADIICLQEMQEDHYTEVFRPEMKVLGYDSVYKKRTGDKNDGCTIFFKLDTFALDSHVEIEYFQPGIPILDRDNIGLIAVLRPQFDPTSKLCVANTHLLFNPRRGDIKLAQLQVLLAELDKAAFKGFAREKALYYPCIMCGDMNSEPFSPLYNFLTRGILDYYGLQSGEISGQREGRSKGNIIHRYSILLPELGITTDCQYLSEISKREVQPKKSPPPVPVLEHGFRFQSAYIHLDASGAAEVTTHHTKAKCTVDYILFSAHHLKENPLSLLGTLRLLSEHDVTAVGGLPNVVLSSDHLALVAKFLLNKS